MVCFAFGRRDAGPSLYMLVSIPTYLGSVLHMPFSGYAASQRQRAGAKTWSRQASRSNGPVAPFWKGRTAEKRAPLVTTNRQPCGQLITPAGRRQVASAAPAAPAACPRARFGWQRGTSHRGRRVWGICVVECVYVCLWEGVKAQWPPLM